MIATPKVCEETLKKASKSFYTASLLLPERLRGDVVTLYAWCRKVDDDIDEVNNKVQQYQNWEKQNARLDAIYAVCGKPDDGATPTGVDNAFSTLVRTYTIPKEFPHLLIEGQLWDCEGKRYTTFEDLTEYCKRVASSVGLMMCCLMGVSADAYPTASSLGMRAGGELFTCC
jgi:phytoene synthase